MKALSLLGGLSLLFFGICSEDLPQILQDHDQKLRTAKTIEVTFTMQKVGAASVEYQLKMAKPNRFKLTSPEGFILSDGAKLYSYVSADKAYDEADATPESLKQFGQRPEVWAWASFLDEKALETLAGAKAGAVRNVKGVPSTEVVATMKEPGREPVTLYVDKKLGVVRSYRVTVDGSELLVMASSLTLGDVDAPAEEFVFVAPAGASKRERQIASAAPPYAEIQGILNRDCMPCHSMQRNSGGIQLTDHAGAAEIVTPGKPAESLMIRSLKGQGAAKMPKGKPSLSPGKVKQIEDWIAAGAKP